MAAEITPFAFPATGQSVRTVTVDGLPWFVGRDVALALGYSNPRDALAKHVPTHHKGGSRIATPSGDQDVTVISEAGMYRLIMRSNAELAERFQEWVTAEVLPAIRSTGSYGPAVARMPDLTTPEGVLVLAEQFATTARQLVAADERIRELEPKAVAHDQFLTADAGDRLIREVAKLIGWKQRDLRVFLMEEKLIFHRQAPCGTHQYDVYAAHVRHFKPVETTVEHTWGSCNHYTLYVRPSGVDLIQRRIARHREAVAGA
jgi:anti-repressor protein